MSPDVYRVRNGSKALISDLFFYAGRAVFFLYLIVIGIHMTLQGVF